MTDETPTYTGWDLASGPDWIVYACPKCRGWGWVPPAAECPDCTGLGLVKARADGDVGETARRDKR